MRVTFLGTGAAGGVPLYGCHCPACERAKNDRRFVRRPCSVLLEAGDTRILIDAGLMDLHERFPPGRLTAILLTHYHPDHVQGLFHLRWGKGTPITVFGPPDAAGCADLYKNPGLLDIRRLTKFAPVVMGALTITPLPLIHSKVTFGYGIKDSRGACFAYLTDTLRLPPATAQFLRAWGRCDLALDCSFPPRQAPANHNDWVAALEVIAAVQPRRSWLTHIGHELDAWRLAEAPSLPPDVAFASDDLTLHIPALDDSPAL